MKLSEMDLYKYHSNPEQLKGYEKRHLIVPELAYETLKSGKKLSPEDKQLALKAIAKDPWMVYKYATEVIKGRFPEGEVAIAKSPKWAYYYATDVIKRRFPEGEVVISKDPYYAYYYATDVIKRRFPEGEVVISKDPYYAYSYAINVIKGRFPEGEAAIAKSPHMAYYYATDVIKGRWPEGEAVISKDPGLAREYQIFLKTFPKDEILEMEQLDEITLKQAITAGMVGATTLAPQTSPNPVTQERPAIVQKAPEQSPSLSPPHLRMKSRVWDTWRSNEQLSTEIATKYKIDKENAAQIVKVARKNAHADFPTTEDILAIIGIESSFQSSAKSQLKRDPALGLMQVRANVWKIPPRELFDVERNIEHGTRILRLYYKKLKSKGAAIQAYNVGIGNLKKGRGNETYLRKHQIERSNYEEV
jgi:hypothetical protein